MSRILSALAILMLAGCAGEVKYIRPTVLPQASQNTKTVDKPRDVVWNAVVPELGKRFFVINNLDKSSGLINLSYSGDPERYVDCGRITSYVKNARGERTYDFAGSKAQQSYEIMNPGQGLFFIDRRMSLEGRVNLVFEEVSANQTRVTANTRYIVSRQRTVRAAANNIPNTLNDTVTLNTGGSATFASDGGGSAAECAATGVSEREILEAVR